VRDLDGDGLPDLVFTGTGSPFGGSLAVYLGSGGGHFRPLRDAALDCRDRRTGLRFAGADPTPITEQEVVALRDVDGDGRAEAVLAAEQPRGDSFRKELKDAKQPIHEYRFHDLRDDRLVEPAPYYSTRVVGHSMDGSFDMDDEGGAERGSLFRFEQFLDLDADGREDLVTVTLDFSVFQVLKILVTKRVGVGLDFHVYAQQTDGSFVEVPDLDLSEKLTLDLNDLKVGRFGQFAGDFDGDGRRDFVHLGRGKALTIHRGQPGCRYPKNADLTIELDEEPPSLELVHIEDLDGDGRSDIRIVRPLASTDPDETAPVRLDLYLSGGRP
jgi:hypothetical protein